MRIIEKNGDLLRTLTLAERLLVEDFVQGRLENVRQLQANQWLMKIRAGGHWLACECRPATLPVMNVTLNSSTGTLFLKNNPGTAEHAADCPFIKDDREPGERRSNDEAAPASWLAPDQPLRLVGEFRESATGTPGQRSGTGSSVIERAEQHRLLSLLMTLIEASGLNVYASHLKKDLTAQFAELRNVASRYPLIDRVPASHYLETRLDLKHMMMLKARLKESTAFGAHRRYGLMLDCVEQVRARKVVREPAGQGFDLQGHHLLWGGEQASGPLLALAIFSVATAGSQFYQLIHLASVPVLSRVHLFPVFRDEEREPLKLLISLIDWMASKGVRVTLRRPVIGAAVMDQLVLSADRDRVLSVSLMNPPLGPEPGSDTFKRLADFKSVDTFGKYVTGFFMRK